MITGISKVIEILFNSDIFLGEKKVDISYRKKSALVFDRLNAPKRKISKFSSTQSKPEPT